MYLTQYRLDKSKKFLENTDMTVTEISYSVSFNGSSYYAEIFRKWYGKSPTEYIKKLKNKNFTKSNYIQD